MSTNNKGNPIFVLGQEYLLDFTQLLATTLKEFLKERWGEEWFALCALKEPMITEESIHDLSFLMRQILDLNNQNFRIAIAESFFNQNHLEKPHLTAFEMIRKSRNFWAHPNREINHHDLKKLAFNIRAIIPPTEALSKNCERLLSTQENRDDLTVIASMTAISEIFRNKLEYRSEMAKSIQEFTSYIHHFSKDKDLDDIFVAQNHLLKNLFINFLFIQPIFYQLQLNQIFQMRDPRTGSRIFNDKVIVDLQKQLDFESGLQLASEFAESVKSELGDSNCDCGFCTNITGKGPAIFREESHKRIDEIHELLESKGNLSQIFDGKDVSGLRPSQFFLIAAVCAARGGISPETIWSQWNFDILNPAIELNSEAYSNHDVMTAAIKLIAIRNGVSVSDVETWNFE